MNSKVAYLTQVALLSVFITLSGAIKIPSIFPGAEFQLSAPIAIAICYAFGIKMYLLSGILSSTVGLILGTHTIFNVMIAMIFRVVVAAIMLAFGRNKLSMLIAGPIASSVARLSLAVFLDKAAYAVLVAAVPGMIYTVITCVPLGLLLEKIKNTALRGLQRNAV